MIKEAGETATDVWGFTMNIGLFQKELINEMVVHIARKRPCAAMHDEELRGTDRILYEGMSRLDIYFTLFQNNIFGVIV